MNAAEKTPNLPAIDKINQDNSPAVYGHGHLRIFIDMVKSEVSTEVPDVSTAKGRERIASLAAKVSKSKKAVENPGRDYLRLIKAKPKVIEAELREFCDEMDKLRDETRAALTQWEEKEEMRVDYHKRMVQHIVDCGNGLIGGQPQPYALLFRELEEKIIVNESFEEFETAAHRAKDEALAKLKESFAEYQKREAEQAELARLREEAEQRKQKDHEEQIAREAADKARKDAEAKAEQERQAEIRAQQERDRAQQEEARKQELALANAKREAAEAEARAAKAEKDAKEKAEQELALKQKQEREAAEKREADIKHQKAINNTAVDALVKAGLSKDAAVLAITTIAQRKVPNVTIAY